MPNAPSHPCSYPGCNNLITGGARCRDHPYDRDIDTRPSAAQRGYGKGWRNLRDWYIGRHPICESCNTRSSEIVDHIVPLKAGGDRLDEDNLQALCNKCHGAKTAVEDPKHKARHEAAAAVMEGLEAQQASDQQADSASADVSDDKGDT